MKSRTKFERKSSELKDLTSKTLTLLSEDEYAEELSRSLRDDDTVIDTLTDLDLAIKKDLNFLRMFRINQILIKTLFLIPLIFIKASYNIRTLMDLIL